MAILKKILAVVGILSVLVLVCVVPCFAFSLPQNADNSLYLYTPVTLDISTQVSTEGGYEDWDYFLAQEEITDTNSQYQFYIVSTEGAGQNVKCINNYSKIQNGGYKGGYTIEFTERGFSGNMTNTLNGFSLPSIWSCRTLKSGDASPKVIVQGNDYNFAFASANYSCKILRVDTGEVIEWTYTYEIDATTPLVSIPVIPDDLKITLDSTGWSNYVLLDYKCATEGLVLRTDADADGIVNSIIVALPVNGSCGRDTFPFASEYGLSYIEKVSNTRITRVYDADFNFTDWLGSAFGFLDVKLFGDFTIGGLLATVIGISLFMAFLKVFAGG